MKPKSYDEIKKELGIPKVESPQISFSRVLKYREPTYIPGSKRYRSKRGGKPKEL